MEGGERQLHYWQLLVRIVRGRTGVPTTNRLKVRYVHSTVRLPLSIGTGGSRDPYRLKLAARERPGAKSRLRSRAAA